MINLASNDQSCLSVFYYKRVQFVTNVPHHGNETETRNNNLLFFITSCVPE